MKKTITIVAVIILLVFTATLILPAVFKKPIKRLIVNQASANLNADFNFQSLRLNLIQSFPLLKIKMEGIVIANKAPFEGDTLAQIGSLDCRLNLLEAVKGRFEVKKIFIDKALIYTHVLDDTVNYTANWDIMLPSEETSTEEEVSESTFSLPVKKIVITNSRFVYNDELYATYISLDHLSLEGLGNFGLDSFDLIANLNAENTQFRYDNFAWINKAKLSLDAIFGMDLINYRFTFKENILKLNEFLLNFDGYMAMPDDAIEFNISFNTPQTEFKDLISLIPELYYSDFENIQTSGQMSLSGKVKGFYSESAYPAFDFQLNVDNGFVKYPDLPLPMKNIKLILNTRNPDSTMNYLSVDIPALHFQLGEETFDAAINLKNALTEPFVDLKVKGLVNLGRMKEFIPLDPSVVFSGILNTDIQATGLISDFENENIQNIKANGYFNIRNFHYEGPEIKLPASMKNVQLQVDNNQALLQMSEVRLGKNDITVQGELKNLVPYVFSSGQLKGQLEIQSRFLDINELMNAMATIDSTQQQIEDTSTAELEKIVLPDDIDFTMSATINELHYNHLNLNNVLCQLELSQGVLNIKNLQSDWEGSRFEATGFYSTRNPEIPEAQMNIQVMDVAINRISTTFPIVKKFVPVIDYLSGITKAKISFNSILKDNMMPDPATITSKGLLSIKQLGIRDFKPLNLLAEETGVQELKNLQANLIQPSYKIENGKFFLTSDIGMKVKDIQMKVLKGSWNALDKKLHYYYHLVVPAQKLSQQAQNLISQVNKNFTIKEVQYVDLWAEMTGTIDKPKIKLDWTQNAESYSQAVKARLNEELEKQKQELKKKAEEELNRQKKILEDKAKAEAERLKKEAEQKAKKELEDKKKQLEEKAKKKLKKLIK